MPEIKRRVIPMHIEYACDECSKAPNPGCLLEFTGKVLPMIPPKYEYTCTNCKKLFIKDKLYPEILYEYES